MKNFRWSAALIMCLALCIATSFGCKKSDGMTAISGTVTLDGAPLADGTINFAPADGGNGTASGAKIVDGKYEARVSPGKLAVAINSEKKVPIENPTQEQIDRGLTENFEEIIPTQYNRTSELKIEVGGGEKTFDFDLKTE